MHVYMDLLRKFFTYLMNVNFEIASLLTCSILICQALKVTFFPR